MGNGIQERKSYDYRWFDLIPTFGFITFCYRMTRSDIRGEINSLRKNIEVTFNLITMCAYHAVSTSLIRKALTGESPLEDLLRSM